MAIDYTKEESINDRVADVYMEIWNELEADQGFLDTKIEDVETGIKIDAMIPDTVDINFSPTVTKYLGLSAQKKTELDEFQISKNDGHGFGFSSFIWMLAERKASAESFKEISLAAESIEKII